MLQWAITGITCGIFLRRREEVLSDSGVGCSEAWFHRFT